MRMGLRGLLYSVLIVLSRIRDQRVVGSLLDILARLATGPIRIRSERDFPYEEFANCEPQSVFDFDGRSDRRNDDAGNCRRGTCRRHQYSGSEARIFAAGGNTGFDADLDAAAVTRPVKGISQGNLVCLFDANANSIGALLLHLAATETLYQINTFEGVGIKDFPKSYDEKWDAARDLEDSGRKTIKGHDLKFY